VSFGRNLDLDLPKARAFRRSVLGELACCACVPLRAAEGLARMVVNCDIAWKEEMVLAVKRGDSQEGGCYSKK